MYGLSKDVDLAFLKNKQLLQICIGSSEAILNFEDYLSITVMTAIHHEIGGRPIAAYEDSAASAVALCRFLACTIVDVQANESGMLRLTFSNGETLELRDDAPQYECYVIKHHEHQIIV
jgi:hypothetical protein